MQSDKIPINATLKKISHQRKSIMMIDDCADILELGKLILEMEGYEVLTALTGKEALTILAEIPAPDLILLDMKLDDMTGAMFLSTFEEKIPEVFAATAVVFLTGVDQVPDSKAVGVIKKPFDNSRFVASVKKFISDTDC